MDVVYCWDDGVHIKVTNKNTKSIIWRRSRKCTKPLVCISWGLELKILNMLLLMGDLKRLYMCDLLVCARFGGCCAFLLPFFPKDVWITIALTCLELCWLTLSAPVSQPTLINQVKPSERNKMLCSFATQTDGITDMHSVPLTAKCAKCCSALSITGFLVMNTARSIYSF